MTSIQHYSTDYLSTRVHCTSIDCDSGCPCKIENAYAKKRGLVSLRTDAYNSIKDASASVIALVGILLASLGFNSFDSLAGLIIGAFVMVAGYFAVKESHWFWQTHTEIQRWSRRSKKSRLQSLEFTLSTDLRVRRSGPFLAVEMHVKVDGNISVFEADKISEEVAKRMRADIVSLGRITIKSEPIQDRRKSALVQSLRESPPDFPSSALLTGFPSLDYFGEIEIAISSRRMEPMSSPAGAWIFL